MEKKALIVPVVAMLSIAIVTAVELACYSDGNVLYFSITAIAAVAGVQITRSTTPKQ